MDKQEQIALEVFSILTEYEFKTIGDQRRFCREIAQWHEKKVAQLEAEVERLQIRMRMALLHLDNSYCECGFHLKETDAADELRDALKSGE
jgi:hypothetical protein